MQVRKQWLELDIEQQTGSNGKRSRSRLYIVTLINLYAEYIMRDVWLDETQTGIKIARIHINNLICADDTTLMAEK